MMYSQTLVCQWQGGMSIHRLVDILATGMSSNGAPGAARAERGVEEWVEAIQQFAGRARWEPEHARVLVVLARIVAWVVHLRLPARRVSAERRAEERATSMRQELGEDAVVFTTRYRRVCVVGAQSAPAVPDVVGRLPFPLEPQPQS